MSGHFENFEIGVVHHFTDFMEIVEAHRIIDFPRSSVVEHCRALDLQAARKEIARISKTIVNSGKLENYGTPRCQEILRKWAEKYQ